MFPGFKSPPIGLKQTNAGNSLYMPYGYSVARLQDTSVEASPNNLVIGSGWSLAAAPAPFGNVILGCVGNAAGSSIYPTTVSGSSNIAITTSVWTGQANAWTNSNSIVIGAWAWTTIPGANSITLSANGYATGTQDTAIGYAAHASGGNCVALGAASTASGTQSIAVIAGSGAGATGNYAVAIGGNTGATAANAIAHGYYATAAQVNSVCVGYASRADFPGEINVTNGGFALPGDIHTSHFPLYAYTTSATAVEAQTAGTASLTTAPATYLAGVANATYFFTLDIVAQVKGGAAAAASWSSQFMYQQGATAATATIIGTPSGLSAPLFSTGTVTGWAVAITADTTNGRPAIKFTGAAATNISWVANVRMTKVGY